MKWHRRAALARGCARGARCGSGGRLRQFCAACADESADLPATGLVQPGSRIHYRLLLAGDSAQLADLRAWLKGQLTVGEKLEDVRDARPEIRTALERAEHFFGLAALTAVVLAGVAMALAARHFIMRHLDTCAMMRCLGATQAQVLRIFLFQFLLLGYLPCCWVACSVTRRRRAGAVHRDHARGCLAPAGLAAVVAGCSQRYGAFAGIHLFAVMAAEKRVPVARYPPRTGCPGAHRLAVCVGCCCAERVVPVAGRFTQAGIDRAGRFGGWVCWYLACWHGLPCAL